MSKERRALGALFAVLAITIVSHGAIAATWTVARDGSGDFTVLQDAVDAASSGDVIQIGPGRYDEFQTLQFGALLFDLHILMPDGMELTFVGSGAAETFIGPADPAVHVNRTYGIGAIDGVDITVRDLTIENCNMYGIGISSGSVTAEDCRFVFFGEFSTQTSGMNGGFSEGAVVRRCLFDGLFYGVTTITSPAGVRVEGCNFVDCITGVYAWTPSSSALAVIDSNFERGHTSIAILQGAGGSIERCTQYNCVLYLDESGPLEIIDCAATRDDVDEALILKNAAPVTIENCVFESNGNVISARSYGGGIFRNNHFIRTNADNFWVHCSDGSSYYSDLDLSGNYWGTTDPDEIAAGIWDCNDSDLCYHCVIFEPMADGPVSVESHTWSAVKSLFRDDGE